MPTIFNVADYFLSRQNDEMDLTNFKLNILCAYAQAVSLCLLNRILYKENIEVWKHNPVIPLLYNKYKHNGKKPIRMESQISEQYARNFFDDEQKFVLEFTYAHYADISASELGYMSHIDFNANSGHNKIIDEIQIKQSFTNNAIIKSHLKNKELILERNIGEEYIPLENIVDLLGK